MTRSAFGGRAAWPAFELPTVDAVWTDLRLADATTHTIASRVDSVSDNGTDWTLSLLDTGGTVGDYPSRQDGWSWEAPADVVAGLAAGGAYVLATRVLITGSQPALSSGYSLELGYADQGGDASVGTCRLLAGGLRWGTGIRPLSVKRSTPDVEGGNASVTVESSLAYIMATSTFLHRVTTTVRSSAGVSDGQAVDQNEANSYTAPLRVVLYAGCDSIAGTGPHSLVFRPQVAWLRVPTA